MLGGDAVAVVGDDEVGRRRPVPRRPAHAHVHPAASVPQRVLDEVGEHLLEPVGVDPHRAGGLLDGDVELVAVGPGGHPALDLRLEARHDVDGLGVHREAAGLDAGGVEQLGDEAGHPVGVGLDRLEHEALLVVGEAVPVAQQRRGEPLDAGERRAQLVGDRRQQGGALLLGTSPGLGVAEPDDDGPDRTEVPVADVVRGDEQLLARGQHEQPLAVAAAGLEAAPRVAHVPPVVTGEVLERQRLADVASDDVRGGEPGDLLGPGVHVPHRAGGADRRDEAVREELEAVRRELLGDPERLGHGGDVTGRVRRSGGSPPTCTGRPWRPSRG